jgi:hypothetical protein
MLSADREDHEARVISSKKEKLGSISPNTRTHGLSGKKRKKAASPRVIKTGSKPKAHASIDLGGPSKSPRQHGNIESFTTANHQH